MKTYISSFENLVSCNCLLFAFTLKVQFCIIWKTLCHWAIKFKIKAINTKLTGMFNIYFTTKQTDWQNNYNLHFIQRKRFISMINKFVDLCVSLSEIMSDWTLLFQVLLHIQCQGQCKVCWPCVHGCLFSYFQVNK